MTWVESRSLLKTGWIPGACLDLSEEAETPKGGHSQPAKPLWGSSARGQSCTKGSLARPRLESSFLQVTNPEALSLVGMRVKGEGPGLGVGEVQKRGDPPGVISQHCQDLLIDVMSGGRATNVAQYWSTLPPLLV